MKTDERAFSRADLLFCCLAGSLLFVMAASLLASNKSESQRAICFNNLRQIGRGFHVWASDHDDHLPWQVSSTSLPQGGTRGSPLGFNAWGHYSVLSNTLATPQILLCPADTLGNKRMAARWDTSQAGGFFNSNYRNNALSYPPLLHADANSPSSLLSADRNFRVDQNNNACTYVQANVCFTLFQRGSGAWTNALHGSNGHLLLMDGSVNFTTSAQLQETLLAPGQDDNGSTVHGLAP